MVSAASEQRISESRKLDSENDNSRTEELAQPANTTSHPVDSRNLEETISESVIALVRANWHYFSGLRESVSTLSEVKMVEANFVLNYFFHYFTNPAYAHLIEKRLEVFFEFQIMVGLINKDLRNGVYDMNGARIPEPDDHYDFNTATVIGILNQLHKMIHDSKKIRLETKNVEYYSILSGKKTYNETRELGFDRFDHEIIKMAQLIKQKILEFVDEYDDNWQHELSLCNDIIDIPEFRNQNLKPASYATKMIKGLATGIGIGLFSARKLIAQNLPMLGYTETATVPVRPHPANTPIDFLFSLITFSAENSTQELHARRFWKLLDKLPDMRYAISVADYANQKCSITQKNLLTLTLGRNYSNQMNKIEADNLEQTILGNSDSISGDNFYTYAFQISGHFSRSCGRLKISTLFGGHAFIIIQYKDIDKATRYRLFQSYVTDTLSGYTLRDYLESVNSGEIINDFSQEDFLAFLQGLNDFIQTKTWTRDTEQFHKQYFVMDTDNEGKGNCNFKLTVKFSYGTLSKVKNENDLFQEAKQSPHFPRILLADLGSTTLRRVSMRSDHSLFSRNKMPDSAENSNWEHCLLDPHLDFGKNLRILISPQEIDELSDKISEKVAGSRLAESSGGLEHKIEDRGQALRRSGSGLES